MCVSCVTLPCKGAVQEMPVFGEWVPPYSLEQGVGDEELMPRTELQKHAPAVIAVANPVST